VDAVQPEEVVAVAGDVDRGETLSGRLGPSYDLLRALTSGPQPTEDVRTGSHCVMADSLDERGGDGVGTHAGIGLQHAPHGRMGAPQHAVEGGRNDVAERRVLVDLVGDVSRHLRHPK
jgi:hypothetical protein